MIARPLLPDDLWSEIAPLLPRPKGGRWPIANRALLTGILFVLRLGLPWEMLPAEMGCSCRMGCWRRLRAWQEAGAWMRLRQVLRGRMYAVGEIGWSRASLDSAFIPGERMACPVCKWLWIRRSEQSA